MRTVPKARGKRITWYKLRVAKWAQDPEGIGTTPEAVEAMTDLVEEARLARVAQAQAAIAARVATSRFNSAIEKMSTAGASIVLQIRAKAGTEGDTIYTKASMPVPRKKSPVAAPGQPSRFTFQLKQSGELVLKWTCPNPKNATGTIYQVSRQLNCTGEFVFIGTAGKKRFVDETLPRGLTGVVYRVQAMRSTKTGPIGDYFIRFGGAVNPSAIVTTRKAA